MIIYPPDWQTVGRKIKVGEIKYRLYEVLQDINCNCLSFSGGLDSSLLLHYMCQIYSKIKVFTTGRSTTHPDVVFAKRTVKYFRDKHKYMDLKHYILCPAADELGVLGNEEHSGDNAVWLFYKFVGKYTDRIIAGDGIDEFMCGYYDHQYWHGKEEIYYDRIRRLQKEHLVPLDKNSGKVKIYLPYINEELIFLFSQIPLGDKVDTDTRKKIMVEIAKGRVPDEVITRRKYGFCDVFAIKK